MRGIIAIAVVSFGFLFASGANSQTWPSRRITMVVGFAAGGGTDFLGRIIANRVSDLLGQPVIVENVSGAGGMIGSARVAKAKADGYTILLASRADTINQTLYKHPLYNLLGDLSPVVLIGEQPTILITRNGIPAHTMPEFIDYVTKNQTSLKLATAGPGSTGMIDCALLNSAIGVKVTQIPYRGSGPAMQDLAAGRVDYICTLAGSAVPFIKGKAVNPIAVLTKNRAPMLPEIPSAWEQGFQKLEASTWFGIMVPKGTSQDIIKKLHDATVTAVEDPKIHKQLLTVGAMVVSPERRSTGYFATYITQDIKKNAAAITEAGVSIE